MLKNNTRLGVIKSDDVIYSYVFIAGAVWVSVWLHSEDHPPCLLASPVEQ